MPSYNFRSLGIALGDPPEPPSGDSFSVNTDTRDGRHWLALFYHEYLHFLQNFTTPPGVAALLNGIAFVNDVNLFFKERTEWFGPGSKAFRAVPQHALHERRNESLRATDTVFHGAGIHPSQRHSVASRIGVSSERISASLGAASVHVFHAVLPYESGKSILLPLTGTAFTEAQAHHLQALVDDDDNDLATGRQLLARLHGQLYWLYYDWLYLYFRQHLIAFDALEAGYALANVALQTNDTSEIFARFDAGWSSTPRKSLGVVIGMCSELARSALVQRDLAQAITAAESRKTTCRAMGGRWNEEFCTLLEGAIRGLRMRQERPDILEGLPFKPELLRELWTTVGAPPMILSTQYPPVTAGDRRDSPFAHAALSLLSAMEQIDRLFDAEKARSPCPFDGKSWCAADLTGGHCKGNLHRAGTAHKGETCLMGHAAEAVFPGGLTLHGT